MAAVGAASAVVQFAGQQQATKEYNDQAAAAHRDAGIAASAKYGDLQRKYNYDAKATNQEGYKAALKARSELGTLKASAGAAGVAGGSATLENLIGMSNQVEAENEARVQAKREDSYMSFVSSGKTIEAEAAQRINSMPFKAGPNPLGLAIGLASASLGGAQTAGFISPQLGGFNTPLFGPNSNFPGFALPTRP
jgi:hypothetical protein